MYVYVAIRFFKESSEEERGHAEKLMKFQVLPKCLLVLIKKKYFQFSM